MISVDLARRLLAEGVLWEPEPGDRFMIDQPTLLDEVSCAAAAVARETHVVTGELSVRYRRPCPVEVPLSLAARIVDEHPRYLVITADLRNGDELLAQSTGKFFFTDQARTAP